MKLIPNSWIEICVPILRGKSRLAEVTIRNLPCEINKKNGKVRFCDDLGALLNSWLSSRFDELGDDPNVILEKSPFVWSVVIEPFPTFKIELKFKQKDRIAEMYSEVLNAIIDALENNTEIRTKESM